MMTHSTQKVSPGSMWLATDGRQFRVQSVIELEGHTWVHYTNTQTGAEFSCWVDSFLQRYREDTSYGT